MSGGIDTSSSGTNPNSNFTPGFINLLGKENSAAAYQAYAAGMLDSESLTAWLASVQTGSDAIRTLNSPASQPTLAQIHYFLTETGGDLTTGFMKLHHHALADLKKDLSANIQAKLKIELAKDPAAEALLDPPDEDYANYMALNEVLSNIATMVVGMTIVQAVEAPPDPLPATLIPNVLTSKVIAPLTIVSAFLERAVAAEKSGVMAGTMIGYLSQVRIALSAAMELLEQMGTLDSKNNQVLMNSKMELTAARLKNTLKQIADAIEAAEKAAHLSSIMKICMPIITAVLVIVDIVVTAVTVGAAAAPAALATSCILGAISLAISVADSETGFMTNAMTTAFKDLQDKLPGNKLEKLFLEIAIMIVAIVVITVLAKGSGGSIGAKMAGREALKEGLEEGAAAEMSAASRVVVRNAMATLASTFTVTMLTSSNVIPDLMGQICEACGSGQKTQLTEWLSQIAQMLVILILVMATLGSKGKGAAGLGKGVAGMSKITQGIEVGGKVLQGSAELAQMGLQIYSAITHMKIAGIKEDQSEVEQVLALINTYSQSFGTDIKNLQEAMSNTFTLVNAISDLFNQIVQGMSNEMNQAWSR